MARVLVTHPLPDGSLEPLVAAGHEIVQRDGDDPLDAAMMRSLVGDVDAVVCLIIDAMDATVLDAGLPRLRVVANVGVGYDNIDVPAATDRGIAVCNTPGVLDETTADIAFLLILAASRRTSDAETALRAGQWIGFRFDGFLGRDVYGATLGIVGYGRIGRAVARRAEGFGMTVLHHSRHDSGERGWRPLDDLLAESDAVTLHVPLSASTTHLIDDRRLRLMKPTAVLVNTARGPVVDEEALADALESGRLFGAGLDVYDDEPRVQDRILRAPHTVLLPHIGSATVVTRARMGRLASEGAAAVLAGERPANLVG